MSEQGEAPIGASGSASYGQAGPGDGERMSMCQTLRLQCLDHAVASGWERDEVLAAAAAYEAFVRLGYRADDYAADL